MGKSNIAVKKWLKNKKRFADLFNGTVFRGKQIVHPADLEEIDSESDIIITDKNGKETGVQRYRDIVMRWRQGAQLVIMACENQNKVHYAMPVRTMIYDGLTYADQITQLWEQRQDKEKITEDEFLSRFGKDDKLYPVISLVFYYGLKSWDGNTDLYEMFYNSEKIKSHDILKAYIPNYPINLIDAGNIKDVKQFQTDLQVILGMLQYKNEKGELQKYLEEHKEYFTRLDTGTYQAIRELLHSQKPLKSIPTQYNDGERVDMCKALDDIYEDGKNDGIKEGMEKAMEALVEVCRDFDVSKEEAINRICLKFSLSLADADEYMEKYWK